MGSTSWIGRVTRAHLLSWRTRIWTAILAIIAIFLVRLPLFGTLGFESSFVLAIFGSVAGADIGSSLVWRARSMKTSKISRSLRPWKLIADLLGGSTLVAGAVLLLPLLLLCATGLWRPNCDWSFGLRCFVLMPLLSAILAGGLGVLAGIVAGRLRWLRIILANAVLLLATAASVVHFYRSPAVFSYNPFVGYFPGNLYDESIDLRAPFYWARLYHISLLVTACALATLWLDPHTLRLRKKSLAQLLRGRTGLAVIGAALASVVTLASHSGDLRFSVSAQDVKDALPGRYESEHFILYYPADSAIGDQIESIASDHEFRRAQLVRDLKVDPPGKITSYTFADPEQKHRLMGARNVYMAKPWRDEIYINHQDFPHPVLRHEIAHVMAGSFGDPIFSVSTGRVLGLPVFFNVGLIEGLAVASDWPGRFTQALTPHQSVKAMLELGIRQPVEKLFSTDFLSLSSARSYTLAGSYLRFLLDVYGIDRMQALYQNGGNFWQAYGKTQAELTTQWRALIEKTTLPLEAAQIIAERFRRKAIFDRPCPHAIARARDSMARDLASGDLKSAIATARRVCHQVPAQPHYKMQLASLLQTGPENPGAQEARDIYTRLADDKEGVSSSVRARAMFELLSLAVRRGEESRALQLDQEILQLPLSDDLKRKAIVFREILTMKGPARKPLQAIFWPKRGEDIDRILLVVLASEASRRQPNLGLPHYLIARQLQGRGSPETTVSELRRALASTLNPLVEREAARLMARAAFLAKDWQALTDAVQILVRAEQPEITRLLGYDWLERAQWAQTGQVPKTSLGWNNGKTSSGVSAPQ